jgi:hypothetical protein
MNSQTIKINGKSFVLHFGMKVFRLLSEKWNVPGINGIFQKLTVLETITDDVSFEQLDVINDLIVASIQSNSNNKEVISTEELDELFLSDTPAMMKIIEVVFQEFTKSIPQAKAVGKKKAANTK